MDCGSLADRPHGEVHAVAGRADRRQLHVVLLLGREGVDEVGGARKSARLDFVVAHVDEVALEAPARADVERGLAAHVRRRRGRVGETRLEHDAGRTAGCSRSRSSGRPAARGCAPGQGSRGCTRPRCAESLQLPRSAIVAVSSLSSPSNPVAISVTSRALSVVNVKATSRSRWCCSRACSSGPRRPDRRRSGRPR